MWLNSRLFSGQGQWFTPWKGYDTGFLGFPAFASTHLIIVISATFPSGKETKRRKETQQRKETFSSHPIPSCPLESSRTSGGSRNQLSWGSLNMSAIALWEAGTLSKEMKGKDWQKPLAAFQHLRFHGKKSKCAAARALQQTLKKRTGLVLQHWRSLQTAAGAAVVCAWHWFVLVRFLTAITLAVSSAQKILLLPKESWGEEGESWAHRGSRVLLRQASGLGNVLGCKTAASRAGEEHVLAFTSCEDGEMECSGGGALCMPKQASPKLREITDVG